jgi:hypothetical protein
MHIYPSEFIILVAFLFMPPLLLAFSVQIWVARRNGLVQFGRFLIAVLLTTVLSVAVGFLIDQFTPRSISPLLRARYALGFPVLPLAFLAVAIVAPPVTFWVLGHGRAKA